MAHFTVTNSPTLHYNMVQQTWHTVISTTWPTLQSQTHPLCTTTQYNKLDTLCHIQHGFHFTNKLTQFQRLQHSTTSSTHQDTYNMVSFSPTNSPIFRDTATQYNKLNTLRHIQHGFLFTHKLTNFRDCNTVQHPQNIVTHTYMPFTHKLTHLENEHIATQRYTLSVHILNSLILMLTW